jgi:hypothetical protein
VGAPGLAARVTGGLFASDTICSEGHGTAT